MNKPNHNFKIDISGISLINKPDNRFEGKAWKIVVSEFQQAMEQSNFLEAAPFYWITIVFRYGLKNDTKPTYRRISKKYGDLPLTIEFDITDGEDEWFCRSLEDITEVFRRVVMICLEDVARKYKLPIDELKKYLRE